MQRMERWTKYKRKSMEKSRWNIFIWITKIFGYSRKYKDEELQKEIIAQMLKCDKRVTQLAEKNIWLKFKKNE